MSMVSPLNLILFGCKKVDFVEGQVRLDNWLNFDMDPHAAAVVCGLRNALEEILVHVVAQPESVLDLDEKYQNALGVIRSLADFSAGDYQITREQGITADRESNFRRYQGEPSGFGGGKFARTDGGNPSGLNSSLGFNSSAVFSSGHNTRGGSFNSGGYNRGGFRPNTRRGFGNRR